MSDKRLALALAALCFFTFAYFVQGAGPNQSSRYDLTRAIVAHRTLSIEAYHRNTFDKAKVGDEHYSDKAPGLSFAAVPAELVFASTLAGGAEPVRHRNGMYFATLLTVSLFSAAASAAFFLLARSLGHSRFGAMVGLFAWVLGSPALAYSSLFVAHQFVASCLLIAFALLAWRSAPRSAHAAAGALASLAAIAEYPASLIAAGLAAYGLARVGKRLIVPFAAAALVPLALLGAYNAACFGSPFSLGYQHLAVAEFRNVIDRGFFGMGAPRLSIVGELLFGEFRGLLPLSPIFALSLFGWAAWGRAREQRLELGVSVGATLYLLLLASSYQRWDGGAAMGPRYFLPALPFAALALPAVVDASARATVPVRLALRAAIVLLLAASIALCLTVTAVLPELPDDNPARPAPVVAGVPSPRHPIAEIVVPLASQGLVSQKAVGPRGTLGLAARLPGHDDDAFNFGELLGLSGLRSLSPLVLVWLLAAAWMRGHFRENAPS